MREQLSYTTSCPYLKTSDICHLNPTIALYLSPKLYMMIEHFLCDFQ